MIPSLLQIPSAVSDSKLHSVLPNNGKGDFQFDRSTGATRINRDGLIEEVGYFSSELVQNGNFSELGSELITNGDFATDSDWTKGTGWVIMNGYAESDGTDSNLSQAGALATGKTYKAVFTVSNMTTGTLSFRLGTITAHQIIQISDNGTYTAYGVAGNDTVRLRSQSGFDGRIDNVSVKQVDPNDRWTLGTGYSFAEDGVKFTNLNGTLLLQNPVWYLNKTYKVTVNLSYISGTRIVLPYDGSNPSNAVTVSTAGTNVTYSYTTTPLANTPNLYIYGDGNATGTIHSVSVKEVLGDRPRLSYDITNGVVEDKPHLLLEPSSTNEITFSKDFTQFNNKPDVTITTGFTAPDGTNTATKVVKTGSNAHIAAYAGINTGKRKSIYARTVSGTGKVTLLNVQSDTNALFDLTEEWQRFDITHSGADFFYAVDFRNAGATLTEVLIWGAQLENLSYATSFIPTAGTTITRAAETCNNSKPSVNSTEGVLYAEIAALADDLTNRTIAINDGTTSNTVRIQYLTISNAIWATVTNIGAGGNQAILQYTSLDITNNTKVALQYKANDFSLFVNGIKVATDSSGATFSANTLNTLQFDRGNGAEDFYGKVKGLAVYNEALSESQLMQLTGVTASSIYNNFVTRTASFTVEALNEVKKVIDNL